ncbi:MAG TPA: RING finger protein [Planctomycetota bacterium]|nr:RING finger protein [Planctomycetota bacterium]
MEGRPAQELEWAARFLRVAIKGRTAVPEDASLKVDASAGDCQVCLEKMDSRVVYCGKCRTPHHEECWSYMGMCSTYGCREIRFERRN